MDEKEKELIAEAAVIYNVSFDEVEGAIESFKNACVLVGEAFAEAVQQVSEFIYELVSEVTEINEQIKKDRMLRKTWHVPKSIPMNHQMLDRMPNVPHMRNRL